jgi:hypothetical protein
MLSERTGQVLARVPLERGYNGSSNFVVHDKQWKSFNRETKYFNPLSIYKLSFQIWEHQGDKDYVPLQPDAEFYMVLEITTKDIKVPTEDPNLKIVEALEKLGKKFDRLSKSIQNPPPPPKQKIPVSYVFIGVLIVGGFIYMLTRSRSTTTAVPGPVAGPPVLAPPAVPLRVPGALPSRLL